MYRKLELNSSLRLGTFLVILTLLASAMVVLFMLHAETDDSSAEIIESGSCGPDAHYDYYSDGTLEISGSGWTYNYSGTIRSPWFDYRTDIKKIVIGDDITNLGAWTFVGCKNVTELTMPITLHTVGSDLSPAFAGCYRIERIDFTYGTDGHGPGYDAYSGNDCWYQNTPWYESRDTLRELNFEDGIVGIGSDTFRELNITSLVLPDSMSILGDHCFFDCKKLTELTYPVSLRPFCNTEYPSFQGCMAIEKVTFTSGNGVPYDFKDVWGNPRDTRLAPWNMSTDIAKTIVISDNITKLGTNMFYGCSIGDLTVPVSIPFCNCEAFYGPYNTLHNVTITKGTGSGYYCEQPELALTRCPWNNASDLESVTIEEGVVHLGDYMFYTCHTKTLVLPNTLATLGKNVFKNSEMTYLTIPITLNAVWLDKYPAFEGVSGLDTVTFTPGDSGYGFDYAAYKGSDCWTQYTPWYLCNSTLLHLEFEDGIKRIGSDSFYKLLPETLVIPDSVETLGNHAFYMITFLTVLTIPITVNCVGSSQYPAFDKCPYLNRLTLTAGTDGIGCDYTDRVPFWNYPYFYVYSITFANGIKYIGANTFTTFHFAEADGTPLETTAANLSGHVFAGLEDWKYYSGDVPDQTSGTPLTGYSAEIDCISRNDPNSAGIPCALIKSDLKHAWNTIVEPNSVLAFDLSMKSMGGWCRIHICSA